MRREKKSLNSRNGLRNEQEKEQGNWEEELEWLAGLIRRILSNIFITLSTCIYPVLIEILFSAVSRDMYVIRLVGVHINVTEISKSNIVNQLECVTQM